MSESRRTVMFAKPSAVGPPFANVLRRVSSVRLCVYEPPFTETVVSVLVRDREPGEASPYRATWDGAMFWGVWVPDGHSFIEVDDIPVVVELYYGFPQREAA